MGVLGVEMNKQKIEFIASFPDIQAIAIGGQVRNARLKIDIPESELVAIVNIIAMNGKKPFKITIEEIEDNIINDNYVNPEIDNLDLIK